MVKWVVLLAVAGIIILLAVRIIKVMWKSERDSETNQSSQANGETTGSYVPAKSNESNDEIKKAKQDDFLVADFTKYSSGNNDFGEHDFVKSKTSDSGFSDFDDDEFLDYSNHMRNRKIRDIPEDFDLDGENADDDFEYIPSSPDFSYLQNQKPKKNTLKRSLNGLSDEMKVLMISNLFDTKF